MTTILVVVALMVLGLALLGIELFVIPGFGVVGVLGLGAVAGSIYLAYDGIGPAYSGIVVAAAVVAAGIMFVVMSKTKAGKSLVLETTQRDVAVDLTLELLLGREGQAITPLRPSGAVDIGGRPVDVVTDGEYVDPGSRVRVVRVEGSRVVVEPLT